MYTLINLEDPKLKPEATSEELHVLFTALDKPEYYYKKMVVIDEDGEIRAGKACAWDRSKHLNFKSKVV
jgi:hypothetical protein